MKKITRTTRRKTPRVNFLDKKKQKDKEIETKKLKLKDVKF